MFTRFTEPAQRAFIRAGALAIQSGRTTLEADLLLLALAEVRPFALESFTATADAVRDHVDTGATRTALAAIGIDVDEVRRRTLLGTDDPALWRLTRSRLRPLRVTLYGPIGAIALAMHARKVVEVAMWKPGAVTGERLLWGLLADCSNGAARILHATGVHLPTLAAEAHIPLAA